MARLPVGSDLRRHPAHHISGGWQKIRAAREASLKMLEMTAGRVATMAQTYLGVRHGPMCFIDSKTLVVCFRSADPVIQRYEEDLIRELYAKRLGARAVFCGAGDLATGLSNSRDLAFLTRSPGTASEDELAILDVVVGQLLGFHRSRIEGFSPDSPSPDCVISRVVGEFQFIVPRRGLVRILIAGELNPDLILRGYRSFPTPGKEVLVKDLELTIGSSSAICAVGLARLGDSVRFLGNVGQDLYGDYCLEILRREGIDASLVNRRPDLKTGLTVSVTCPGDRALITYPGAIASLTAQDVPRRRFPDALTFMSRRITCRISCEAG